MFLSYELSKGRESFWYPYLRILPVPGTISNWNQIELAELQVLFLFPIKWILIFSLWLQDPKLIARAGHKKATLQVNNLTFSLILFLFYSINPIQYDKIGCLSINNWKFKSSITNLFSTWNLYLLSVLIFI